eukprot:TRINITY_DN64896_c0_g1_i1.p2 TRINITY_DN64896_c0_g1~~TRINITY_DN64896_c0_g1_i1.p2  ORF type:complete len:172 (+),score=0.55 TRINITY_DN64896_c0_g1_i1:804-1319(+)
MEIRVQPAIPVCGGSFSQKGMDCCMPKETKVSVRQFAVYRTTSTQGANTQTHLSCTLVLSLFLLDCFLKSLQLRKHEKPNRHKPTSIYWGGCNSLCPKYSSTTSWTVCENKANFQKFDPIQQATMQNTARALCLVTVRHRLVVLHHKPCQFYCAAFFITNSHHFHTKQHFH